MIYLDNAATTKPDEECLEAAKKYLYCDYFNPSSLYKDGYKLQGDLKLAKTNILNCIANEDNFDLIFTSCGTEADNQAIFCGGKRGNIVTTAGEHSAILSAVNEATQRGLEVRIAKINKDGTVNVDDLLSLIDDKTSLVSVIHVNNEMGAINDIADIARRVKRINKYSLFHSDGVQAFGKIPFKLTNDIDLYSISAHKIGGIKGCGALIKRKNLQLKAFVFGGGQQSGLRSGTENVFGIKDFEYAAIKKYNNLRENYEKVEKLHELLWDKLDKSLFLRISPDDCSPYILTVSCEGLRGETILHEVDDEGLIIGTGSACSSNEKRRYSGVILACGYGYGVADGVLRLSLSSETTEDEILSACEILNRIVKNRKAIMA